MSSTLCGRYRLDSRIGGGGMGEVWRAYDHRLAREVAVKVIHSHLAGNDTVRARLTTEARLAGSLHHPGIVDVFDFGEHEEDGRTIPFIVMPLVEGPSLSDLLAARGALSAGQTMAIVADLADALQAAHSAGIVHRDLKPGNVLMTHGGRVMLVDFGIARAVDAEPLTDTGTVLGTADYISPEQAEGRSATAASDVYALGVVAYACLVGTPPYHRESNIATALAHIQHPLPPLPDDVPREVRALVGSLLAKDPAERPQPAGEVARAARSLASTIPGIPPLVPSAPSPPVTRIQERHTSEPLPSIRTRFRRPRAALGAAVLVAAAAFGLMSIRGTDRVTIPDVRGDNSVEASAELARLGLTMKPSKVDAAGHEAGEVLRQSPAPGVQVEKDSDVAVTVASGEVPIPKDLIGMSYASAAATLDSLGLKVSRVDRTSTRAAGTVIAVAPDTRAAQGDTIELTVARAAIASPPTPSGDDSKGKAKGRHGR
jgi:serine/threonine protein kinase